MWLLIAHGLPLLNLFDYAHGRLHSDLSPFHFRSANLPLSNHDLFQCGFPIILFAWSWYNITLSDYLPLSYNVDDGLTSQIPHFTHTYKQCRKLFPLQWQSNQCSWMLPIYIVSKFIDSTKFECLDSLPMANPSEPLTLGYIYDGTQSLSDTHAKTIASSMLKLRLCKILTECK